VVNFPFVVDFLPMEPMELMASYANTGQWAKIASPLNGKGPKEKSMSPTAA
jgi:hypothetical protein